MRAVVLSPQCNISVPSIHIGVAANVKNVVIPCHVMPCHVISCHDMSCHAINDILLIYVPVKDARPSRNKCKKFCEDKILCYLLDFVNEINYRIMNAVKNCKFKKGSFE